MLGKNGTEKEGKKMRIFFDAAKLDGSNMMFQSLAG